MTISHAAIWVSDLELMRVFYEKWFGGKSGPKYHNQVKKFESYFLSFDTGARLELMRQEGMSQPENDDAPLTGFAHIAFSVGSESRVDSLTAEMTTGGVSVLSLPRRTGDKYYESVIADPEGNVIEITV
jgi:lactoylglutathione lyase